MNRRRERNRRMTSAVVALAVAVAAGEIANPPAEAAPPPVEKLYVVNGLGESLSEINLATGQVASDRAALGLYPNQLVLHQDTGYCVNSGSSDVTVLDMTAVSVASAIGLGENQNPWDLVVCDDSTAFVSCAGTNTVRRVDLGTGQVTDTLGTGVWPEGMGVTHGKLYVANCGLDLGTFSYGQGTVSVFALPGGDSLATILVGTNPQWMALAPDSTLHVVCTGNYADVAGAIYVIDPVTDQVADSLLVGGVPGPISIGPDGKACLGATAFGPQSSQSGIYTYDALARAIVRGAANPILSGTGISGVLMRGSGVIYACDFGGDRVYELDWETGDALRVFEAVGDGPQVLALRETLSPAPIRDTLEIAALLEPVPPSPRRGSATLRYHTRVPGLVSLETLDVTGKRVSTLVRDQWLAADEYREVTWDIRGAGRAATGVYWARLTTPGGEAVQKIVLVR